MRIVLWNVNLKYEIILPTFLECYFFRVNLWILFIIILTLFCRIDLVISGSILQEVNNSKKDANFKRSASQREIFLTQFAFSELWWTICAKYTSKTNVSKPYFFNLLERKSQGSHPKSEFNICFWNLKFILTGAFQTSV